MCMRTCMHACMHAYIHTYIRTYLQFIYLPIDSYIYIYIYILLHMLIYIFIYIYTYIHAYMHACMHACMHTYIVGPSSSLFGWRVKYGPYVVCAHQYTRIPDWGSVLRAHGFDYRHTGTWKETTAPLPLSGMASALT